MSASRSGFATYSKVPPEHTSSASSTS